MGGDEFLGAAIPRPKTYGMDLEADRDVRPGCRSSPLISAGIASGYLTKLYTRLFGLSRVNSVVAIIGQWRIPDGFAGGDGLYQYPYIAIVLIPSAASVTRSSPAC